LDMLTAICGGLGNDGNIYVEDWEMKALNTKGQVGIRASEI
jgi:hypothetical protein